MPRNVALQTIEGKHNKLPYFVTSVSADYKSWSFTSLVSEMDLCICRFSAMLSPQEDGVPKVLAEG